MIKKILLLVAISACSAVQISFAATIPAGTTLTVRTLDTVSSQDRAGRTFNAEFVKDLSSNGTVALKAGTKFIGKVEASRADRQPLGPLNSEPQQCFC